RFTSSASAARPASAPARCSSRRGALYREWDDRLVGAADQLVVAVPGQLGQHDRLVPGSSAAHDTMAVDEQDVVVARAGRDVVGAVAGIEPVAAAPALEMVDLAGRLFRWLVVAPDHVSIRAGVDRVVAVAAEQLVVTDIRGHTVGVRVPVGAARPSACCSTAA